MASVLGQTSVNVKADKPTHLVNEYDVVVASSADALLASCVAPVAFLPIKPEHKPNTLCDWNFTGYEWHGFYEYSLEAQSVTIIPAIHSLKDSKFAIAENDPNSLACLVHPVSERIELDRSTILAAPFHSYRRGNICSRVKSDVPFSHVYDDMEGGTYKRGIPWPVTVKFRRYVQYQGVWKGHYEDTLSLDHKNLILVYHEGSLVLWDFVTPKIWLHLHDQCLSTYRKGIGVDYKLVWYKGTSSVITYVPTHWTQAQVSEMLDDKATPVPGGWTGTLKSPIKVDVTSGNSGASLWFHVNGGLSSHFSVQIDADSIKLRARSMYGYGQTIESINHSAHLFAAINAVYDMDCDGPFIRGTDLKTCDRGGKPQKRIKEKFTGKLKGKKF